MFAISATDTRHGGRQFRHLRDFIRAVSEFHMCLNGGRIGLLTLGNSTSLSVRSILEDT